MKPSGYENDHLASEFGHRIQQDLKAMISHCHNGILL